MIFYYGADKVVTKPIYGLGNPTNDYGLGFYLTKDLKMAKLWACRFKYAGFVIKYD